MMTKRTAGRPKGENTVRLVVKITPSLDRALDAHLDALNAKGGESYDRSRFVRGLLTRALAAELKAAAG